MNQKFHRNRISEVFIVIPRFSNVRDIHTHIQTHIERDTQTHTHTQIDRHTHTHAHRNI